eukprot:TRINITY_DN104785_c0_g1_i1.p1 TRINITY_DN104785_c0_g1~~TRINITY_DN104785_c0_g1_i1.p1  ORF type:complete len:114 (-),score=21.79 TRINITY_DN104785_c0_g1_i1:232-573(-)
MTDYDGTVSTWTGKVRSAAELLKAVTSILEAFKGCWELLSEWWGGDTAKEKKVKALFAECKVLQQELTNTNLNNNYRHALENRMKKVTADIKRLQGKGHSSGGMPITDIADID